MDVLDDDDDFLYGATANDTPTTAEATPNEPAGDSTPVVESADGQGSNEDDDEEDDMDEDDSEDDIEIITDGPVLQVTKSSIDYRPRPTAPAARTLSSSQPSTAQSTLTTEYKPLERDSIKKPAVVPPTPPAAVAPPTIPAQKEPEKDVPSAAAEEPQKSAVDPSTLPVVTAPPSAPKFELNKEGNLDGRSIYEIDIASLENKAWRRPGSDLSDWFNYGFDEISWEAYAARRRDLGEMAPILKANVLTFSGMSEEQVLNLPSDLRGMVMMSSNVAANSMGQPGGPNMMGGTGGAMHPEMIMNMGMMGNMPGNMPGNVGPEIGLGGQQMMMQGMGEAEGPTGVPGMMPGMDYPSGGGMPGGMDYMQDPNNMGGTPNYPAEGGSLTPTGPAALTAGRGTVFRGRVQPVVQRGIRGTPFRGRGRGFEAVPPTGPRAASPLPPNVPTGPRNQHRYKDRDTGAPTSEPLDYGGDVGGAKSDKLRDEFGRDIDRSSKDDDSSKGSSRKRRGSPPDDSGRSKRR